MLHGRLCKNLRSSPRLPRADCKTNYEIQTWCTLITRQYLLVLLVRPEYMTSQSVCDVMLSQ